MGSSGASSLGSSEEAARVGRRRGETEARFVVSMSTRLGRQWNKFVVSVDTRLGQQWNEFVVFVDTRLEPLRQ